MTRKEFTDAHCMIEMAKSHGAGPEAAHLRASAAQYKQDWMKTDINRLTDAEILYIASKKGSDTASAFLMTALKVTRDALRNRQPIT